jgi:hypothetical protein
MNKIQKITILQKYQENTTTESTTITNNINYKQKQTNLSLEILILSEK